MKNIRNILFAGSQGSGKTTIIEQILFNTKSTTRLGRVEEGNSVMDYSTDEIKKQNSMVLSVANLNHKGLQLNFLDSPGNPDFVGEQIIGAKVVESVVLVVSASSGFDPGFELSCEHLQSKKSAALLVNKMDHEHVDFYKLVENLASTTELPFVPICIPIGSGADFAGVVDLLSDSAFINGKKQAIPESEKENFNKYKELIVEAVAETSEEFLEKYLEEGTLSEKDISSGLKAAINRGEIIPVVPCSCSKNIGIEQALSFICDYMPSPEDVKKIETIQGDKTVDMDVSTAKNLFSFVFKTYSDPLFGDLALVRVFAGELKSGASVYIPEKNVKDKIGSIYKLFGKKRIETSILKAGEIGGLVKLKSAKAFDTIGVLSKDICFPPPALPSHYAWKSISAVNQHDEDKISPSLAKLAEEDKTLKIGYEPEIRQTIIAGISEQQINLVKTKLESRYKIQTMLGDPKIPYKETINGKSESKYRHKKQSGGRGQYAEVYFRVAPKQRGEGFEFINSIVGGSIPSKFIPAIEKGLVESIEKGIIAGYKVVDISVEVYDGTFHDVDSSEMAFKIAASHALKIGFKEAKPVLLEPICNVKIVIPSEYSGDVMSDITTRRGRLMGMDQKGNKQILNATVPLAELYSYYPSLKSLTQGRGRFVQEFDHYEQVPNDIAQKIIKQSNKDEQE